ncbi:MAG: GNAT family N-acetyltransferase [Pseudomonadota bacterium]
MAIIGVNPTMPGLAFVRRLEAVGFRAWPASSVHYDGSWAVRLTASHPSRRLNSVNPLDPADYENIENRIQRIEKRFASYSRPLVFRMSPLAPPPLQSYLDSAGWPRIDETAVLTGSLTDIDIDGAIDQLPLQDVGRFVDTSIRLNEDERVNKPGLTEVLEAIRPPYGMFIMEDDNGPIACALCVHDNDMAGLFNIAVREDKRSQGYGRSIVRTALRWAHGQGAHRAWLQVEQKNASALALYKRLGFDEAYRYVYRTPTTASASTS